jgi:two-component system response regulator HydG
MPRILVVDDAARNLAVIEAYLRGTEFEVVTASDGHAAIDACMRQSFELILLDVAMPGIDGFEVCRRLKNDPRTAFVPVIFLTARLIDESEKLAAYRLGAVDYIQKPVDREELTARIRVMLRLEDARSRLDRENAALRRQLDETQQALGAASESLHDLQRLRQEWARAHDEGLLVVDAGLRVVAADDVLSQWLGELPVGSPLGGSDVTAARLARLLENGARAAELATGNGTVLQVRAHTLPDGRHVVVLQDVTGVRAAERAVQAREAVPPVAPELARPRVGGYAITDFVGRSPAVLELCERVAMLRQTRTTVLIHGETGTGKELVARALHFDGQNRSAPFIPLHCGAIAPELVESELFGHEKGAFTGAQQARDGLFRAADGGTIFLDEIAETSPSVQVKLLRVLQRGEIRPVGASQPRIVDVRILAATNSDLAQLVRQGRFREDLYYRLEVVTLHLPPLRERLADLPLLVEHFLAAGNRRHGRRDRPVRGVSRAAMERLLAYPWPGNVRELESVIEHAFALGVGDVLQEEDLAPNVLRGTPALARLPSVLAPAASVAAADAGGGDFRSQREAAERQAILQALRDSGGDKVAAAERLRLPRSTFYRRLRELGL